MAGISGVHSTEGGSMFSDGPHRVLDKRLMGEQLQYDDEVTWPFSSMLREPAGQPGVAASVEVIGGCIATDQAAERCFIPDESQAY
ncbi:MAG: hypothetical protein KIH63_002610 [Candidatus Saccharibacteria bacterium]|nr:hypothetical protein [Candidatus Saccharibacteria bacterium]